MSVRRPVKSIAAKKRQARLRRARSLRMSIRNHTNPRPRLSVDKSLQHICAQLFTNDGSEVIVSVSTREKAIKQKCAATGNIDAAKIVGAELASRAKAKGVTQVTFDRSGYAYHGRVKALAEAAREQGMDF